MRFLSKYGRFAVQIQNKIEENYATGMSRTLQEGIYARFEPGLMRPMERELALAHWSFNGFYQEADEVTIVPPDYRIGVFDSDQAQSDNQWSDETRLRVETELSRLAGLYDDMLIVPRTTLPAPWPNYDSFEGTLAALMRKLVDDGYDLNQVLLYEEESQKRPEVITALEELISNPTGEPSEIPLEEEVLG